MRPNQLAALVLAIATLLSATVAFVWRDGPPFGTTHSSAVTADDETAFDVGGVRGHAPPGSTVTVQHQAEAHDRGGNEHREISATGTGSGLRADGKDINLKDFNAAAPTALLPSGTGATGGSLAFSEVIKGGSSTSWLMWAAILCWIGALWSLYRGNIRGAIVCAVLGAALFIASLIPLWAWILIGACVALVVGVYLYLEHKHAALAATIDEKVDKYKEPLRAVLAGIESLPDNVRKMAKAAVAAHAEAQTGDTATITEVKREDGLPSERTGA